MPVNLTVTVKEPENTIATPSTGFFTQTPNLNQDTSLSIPNHSIVFTTGFTLLLITATIITIKVLIQRKQKTVFKLSKTKSLLSLSVVVFIILGALIGLIAYQSSPSLVTASNEETETNSNTLSITAEDINLNIELEDEPVFAMAQNTITVKGPAEAGYVLSAYVENPNLVMETSTINIASNTDSVTEISALSANQPTTKLTANTWGLALEIPKDQNDAVFLGLPETVTNSLILKETTTSNNNDQTTIYFGVYATPDLAYGTYTGVRINYIVVANSATLYMQDVAEWKDTLVEGEEIIAVDARDNKTYTVAKFRDGNIWMTQNLDHDIDINYNYTNENTDIGWNTETESYDAATWAPARSTYATGDMTWGLYNEEENWYYGYTQPESYDPGDVYWNGTISDHNDWDVYLDSCDRDSVICDENLNPYSTYVSATGDSHYHLGNYYNWSAAVAMNDTSELMADEPLVERSICPAGWTLPRIGFDEDTFERLWDNYDFFSSSFVDANSNDKYDDDESALWTNPLYFAASGIWEGILSSVGGGGFFWSPITTSKNSAGGVGFNVEGPLKIFDRISRALGFSVRCLARPVSKWLISYEHCQ